MGLLDGDAIKHPVSKLVEKLFRPHPLERETTTMSMRLSAMGPLTPPPPQPSTPLLPPSENKRARDATGVELLPSGTTTRDSRRRGLVVPASHAPSRARETTAGKPGEGTQLQMLRRGVCGLAPCSV